MTWNLTVTQEYATRESKNIQRFLRAIVRANRYIDAHPDKARAISAKHIGTDSPLYESEWQDYHFTAALDQSLILNMEDQARWMMKRDPGGPKTPPNSRDLVYADGLQAVSPEGISIAGQ